MRTVWRSIVQSTHAGQFVRVVVFSCCLVGTARAAEEPSPAVTVRGFGTLGAVRASSGAAEFVRDLSQPKGARASRWSWRTDSILGIQINAPVASDVEAVGQVVSRYRYDATYRPEVMWGFLKWDLRPELSLRGGRLGTDFFMLADSRLVGYSNLPVRPPTDYFGILPFSYIDGGDALVTWPVGGGLLRGKAFAGYTREKVPLAERQWDLDGSLMRGGHLDFQRGAWTVRAGYARIRFDQDLPIADLQATLRSFPFPAFARAADTLTVKDKDSRFYSAGLVYDDGPLQLQLMFNRTRHDSILFQNSRAAYVIAGYRLDSVTPYAGYAQSTSRPKSQSDILTGVAPLDATVASTLGDSHTHQHTWSLGARWDLAANVDLKLQLDAVRGEPASIFLYRGEQPGWRGRTNIFSVVTDFVF